MATGPTELAVFQVGPITGALDIGDIQEINKHLDITAVFNAPPCVRGVLNLRGRIITVIDLREKLGLPTRELDATMRIIVVADGEEHIGLLVDRILDVTPVDPARLEAPPSHIRGVSGAYFASIYKMNDGLAAILDIAAVLGQEEHA